MIILCLFYVLTEHMVTCTIGNRFGMNCAEDIGVTILPDFIIFYPPGCNLYIKLSFRGVLATPVSKTFDFSHARSCYVRLSLSTGKSAFQYNTTTSHITIDAKHIKGRMTERHGAWIDYVIIDVILSTNSPHTMRQALHQCPHDSHDDQVAHRGGVDCTSDHD